jgi:hypothetical protein
MGDDPGISTREGPATPVSVQATTLTRAWDEQRWTFCLWGIVDLRCNPLVVLLLTGRWLLGSSLRLTA